MQRAALVRVAFEPTQPTKDKSSVNLGVKFSPKVDENHKLFGHDTTGRERMILTLWDPPQRGGALRMAFLYDTKQRSSDRTHDTVALAYIGEIKGMWLGVKDVKIVGPTKVSEPSYDYWRLDFSTPNQVPRYNSAIAIQSKISTAEAITVVHSPRLSPTADCVTLAVRTILFEMR
jgi:hypothetical protein